MKQAYIVDAVRTPVGRFAGSLATIRPDDMAAYIIKAVLERNPAIDVNEIEDVIFGAANQAGEDNRNVARMALLLAGLPTSIGGVTVNRLCASGLQAIMDASRAVMLGEADIYIAGGVESMSRAPFVMAKAEQPFDRKAEVYDTSIGWRFTNPKLAEEYFPFGMGETAENVAVRYKIDRDEQDRFAYDSQRKYKEAHEQGKFKEEIIPVPVPQRKGDPVIFDTDEHPRFSPLEKLAALKPAFKKDGTVTAGNASGINDGAAACIVASEDAVKKYDLKPMARVVSMAVAGVHPDVMGLGPVPSTQKALNRAGISVNDLDLIEINEAFAVQSIACIRNLGLDDSIVNVNGGSIAIGHPLGCSGTRITTTLLHELQRRTTSKYGIATMCVGVGQGASVVYERI